jgi:ferredoxin
VPTVWYRTSDTKVEFEDGEEVNLLRVAIRNDCGVPYKCASGNCGTDRVRIEEGAEHLSRVRPKERDRLGDDIDRGYRLACQTYADGDVTLSWDPNQTGTMSERIRQKWLEGDVAVEREHEQEQGD